MPLPAREDASDARGTDCAIQGTAAFAKRAVDVTVSTLLLILMSPVLVTLGLLIRLQDGGPALYRRRVVGREHNFDAFKLRTMRTDSDKILKRNPELRREFEINFKLINDPRVTRLGRLLRRTSLDEVPQLWNVLKGEMSLVGPRMISPEELSKYGESSSIFRSVKPGLTGYWQVEARPQVSYKERVAMDLYYVKNWSLLLDAMIILRTPRRVIRGTGAE